MAASIVMVLPTGCNRLQKQSQPTHASKELKQRPISGDKFQTTCCSFPQVGSHGPQAQLHHVIMPKQKETEERLGIHGPRIWVCAGAEGQGRRYSTSPWRNSLWNCDFPSIGYLESGTVICCLSSQASYREESLSQ